MGRAKAIINFNIATAKTTAAESAQQRPHFLLAPFFFALAERLHEGTAPAGAPREEINYTLLGGRTHLTKIGHSAAEIGPGQRRVSLNSAACLNLKWPIGSNFAKCFCRRMQMDFSIVCVFVLLPVRSVIEFGSFFHSLLHVWIR